MSLQSLDPQAAESYQRITFLQRHMQLAGLRKSELEGTQEPHCILIVICIQRCIYVSADTQLLSVSWLMYTVEAK